MTIAGVILTGLVLQPATQAAQAAAAPGPAAWALQIAAGAADAAINDVLRLNSIPGYSRHHSGYAMDLSESGGGLIRAGSALELWLREARFARAVRRGFLPSYPPGGGRQGPDPEAWEYVYVGSPTILCAGWYLSLADPSARWSCPR